MNTKTIIKTFSGLLLCYLCTASHAEMAQSPLFLIQSVEPNILIDMSVETPMGGAAYNDQNNTNPSHPAYNAKDLCNGRITDSDDNSAGVCYNPKKKYIGIYNPFKCYTQSADNDAAYFSTHSATQGGSDLPDLNGFYQDATFQCNGQWSGNILNWSTMTAVDIFSVAMTGGNRVIDTSSTTVLEGARRHTNKSWFPSKIISKQLNVAPSTVTPYTADAIEIKQTDDDGYKFTIKVFGEGDLNNETDTTTESTATGNISCTFPETFYMDDNVTPKIDSAYLTYEVTATSAINDAWIKVALPAYGTSGTHITRAQYEDGLYHIGEMAAGEKRTAFIYVNTESNSDGQNKIRTIAEKHDIALYEGKPTSSNEFINDTTCKIDEIKETIKAKPNKVKSVSYNTNSMLLGDQLIITVKGNTGKIGYAGVMWFNPSVYGSWPADSLQLVDTNIDLNGVVFNDRTSFTYKKKSDYTATYTFDVVAPVTGSPSISPVAQISSGQQVKHTDTKNFGSFSTSFPSYDDSNDNTAIDSSITILTNIQQQTTARYVKLIAKSSFNNKPWTSIAEINLINKTDTKIPQNTWSILSFDSEEPTGEGVKGGHASHAIDDNTSTFWHTAWKNISPVPAHDHQITIDMGATHDLQTLCYLPRQDGGANGRVNAYEIYLSNDGNNWGSAITTGNFADNANQQSAQISSAGSYDCATNTGNSANTETETTDYTTSPVTEYVYNTKVKVCDFAQGLEENCVRYGTNTYKPEGLMQRNSERMRFGVMAYSKDNSKERDGGVLRANMGYIGLKNPDGSDNTEKAFSNDGTYVDKPITLAASDIVNTAPSYTGALNYINKFHKDGYKSYDPISELYYETIRYFKNGGYPSSLQGPTPEYIAGLENVADSFPVIKNWQDPIQYSCQKNFIIGLNDAFPWLDKKLPGTQFTSDTFQGLALKNNDFGEPSKADPDINVTALTNQVHNMQAPTDMSQCVVGEVLGNCLTSTGRQNSYYIAGLAYYANTTDLRSDIPGNQTISTFMIDSQEYNANPPLGPVNMLWLASKYGGFIDRNENNQPDLQSEWDNDSDGQPDTYVLASSPDKMVKAFDKAFTEIKSRVGASSSAAANTSQLSANAKVYQARFDSSDWSGQLFAYNLVTANNTGDINNRLWEAGKLIPAASTRKIYSYDPETTAAEKGITFQWGSLNPSQQALLNKDGDGETDTKGENRLAWLRGERIYERNNGGIYRDRTTLLGDIVHSDPTYSGAIDNYGYALLAGAEGNSYSAFVATKINRQPSVYFGSNDGMLHAIHADTGVETFAYVPNEVIKDLGILSSPLYGCKETSCKSHQYYVDGSPKVGDAYFADKWRTILVGSLGAGGKGIFALDITDPTNFDKSKVMWELSATQAPDSTSATTYANELGYTLPQASVVRMANGQWAAIVANGYESENKQATLLIIDVATGALIKALPTGVGDASLPNGLSTALPVDLNADRIVDAIYAGDLQGNLWKFNVTDSDPDQWKIAFATSDGDPAPFFKACPTNDCVGTPQPITAKPQVTRNNEAGGVMVYVGTGKYFESNDSVIGDSPQVQTFYALHDKGEMISQKNTLVEQVITTEADFSSKYKYRLSTSKPVDYTTHYGWYMDLKTPDENGGAAIAKGERIISGALLRQGRVVFVTMTPASDPCSYGGESWLMELNSITGAYMDKAVIDISKDYKFDSNDDVTVTNSDGSQETRVISGIQEDGLGIIFKTPVVMKHSSGAEGKYVNGSSGSLGMIKESTATPIGRQSWRTLR